MKPTSAIVVACACGFPIVAFGQSVTLLGPGTLARGVSADGSVVVGLGGGGGGVAMRWTQSGGRQDFGAFGTSAYAVSGDGSVIVGETTSGPMRWTGMGPGVEIPQPPPAVTGRALGASNDGSVIVGYLEDATFPQPFRTAFRWTESGGTQVLNVAPGDEEARGVSRDGLTLVGNSGSGNGARGFAWTAGGAVFLQSPGGAGATFAYATNFDGSLIAGFSQGGATLWRNGAPEVLPPSASGFGIIPRCLNDSGTVVGGVTGTNAGIWTLERGSELLSDYLASFGLSFPAGYRATSLLGVSSDGLTLVGTGEFATNAQGFVVTIPSPGAASLLTVLGVVVARRRRVVGERGTEVLTCH